MKTENKQVTLNDRLKEAQDRFGLYPYLGITMNEAKNTILFVAYSETNNPDFVDHFVEIQFDQNCNNSASCIRQGFFYYNHKDGDSDRDFCTDAVVDLNELNEQDRDQKLKVAQYSCGTVLTPWGDKTFLQNSLFDITAFYIDQYLNKMNKNLYVHFNEDQPYKPALSFTPYLHNGSCGELYNDTKNYAYEFGINQALYGVSTIYGNDSKPICETFPDVSATILKYNEEYLHLPVKENTLSSYHLALPNTIPTVGDKLYVLSGPVIHKMTVDSVEIRANDIYLSGETEYGSLKVSLPNAFRTEIAAETVRNQRFPGYVAENEKENEER